MANNGNALAPVEAAPLAPVFDGEHVDHIKRACQASGCSADEFQLFLFTAKRRRLDPLAGQICAVMRWSQQAGRKVMSIQTTIDGLRLQASRTGEHVGTETTIYDFPHQEQIESAIAVLRRVGGDSPAALALVERLLGLISGPPPKYPDMAKATVSRVVQGEPRAFTVRARWAEFAAKGKDGTPTRFWAAMPRHMLGKVAESHGLRTAFPAELSGQYTDDEMGQAENPPPVPAPVAEASPEPAPAPAYPRPQLPRPRRAS